MSVYQVMPDLTEEEYENLKADIALRGVMDPIQKDEFGNIIDGHHRLRACQELGITDYPVIIHAGLSEAEKISRARSLNLNRRHLSPEARRAIMADLRAQGMSYRAIADLAGVSHTQVKRDIDSGVTNVTPDAAPAAVKGKDGKVYPAARPVSVFASTEREHNAALSIFDKSPEIVEAETSGGVLTITDLRKTEKIVNRAKLDAIEEAPEPKVLHEIRPGSWWRLGRHLLYCGDTSSPEFRSAAPACPFAFADPPYNVGKAEWDTAFEWRHDWLATCADVVAVTPGISEFSTFLRKTEMPYRWTFTGWIKNGMTRGAMGFGNTLLALLFSNGSLHRNAQDFMSLVVETGDTEETDHPSRKPSRFVAQLVEVFSSPGDSIIDPFLGSGTTLFVAEQMDRAAFVGELNPDYCSEVIGRWEAMTGLEAEEVRV